MFNLVVVELHRGGYASNWATSSSLYTLNANISGLSLDDDLDDIVDDSDDSSYNTCGEEMNVSGGGNSPGN